MDGINIMLLGGTVCLVGMILIAFFQGRQRGTTPDITPNVSVTLEELSKIWAGARETGEIRIDELAPIWREQNDAGCQEEKTYLFRNKKVADFFREHIEQAPWFGRAFLQKEVCYRILSLLEEEGGCPSVVNAADDVEASWDSTTYDLLGKTTLLDHSLNVGLEVIRILRKDDALHVIPDTLVAALGHDLGKLPSIKSHLYSLGEHPLAAGRILAVIPSYNQLARKDEISRAIKLHHKQPQGLLGQTLKKADQQARQKELERVVESLDGENSAHQENVQEKNPKKVQPGPVAPPLAAHTKNSSSSKGSHAAWRAQADIYGEEEPPKKKSEAPRRIDISAWFNATQFLEALKPYINRVTGRRFMAFSMGNGYVFFQAKVLEEVARKQAEQAGAMDVATMAADDPTMRRVLFTVVDHLRQEDGVLARELVKDQYFGGYFTITTGGRPLKGFYTPFHAEAFGSIAEMENRKTGILKNFRSVKPFSHKE